MTFPWVDRGSGSGAFTQLVRASFGVGKYPSEDPAQSGRFVFTRIVNNLAPRSANPSLTYEIEPWADDPAYPRILWGEAVDLTADDVLSKSDARKHSPRREEAKVALNEVLADGPVAMKEVMEYVQGKTQVSADTVRAAFKELHGVTQQDRGDDGKKVVQWEWALPPRRLHLVTDIDSEADR